jgi:hypothetical protein
MNNPETQPTFGARHIANTKTIKKNTTQNNKKMSNTDLS